MPGSDYHSRLGLQVKRALETQSQKTDGVNRTATDLAAASVRLALEGAVAHAARVPARRARCLLAGGRREGGTDGAQAIERLPTPCAEESLEAKEAATPAPG